MLILGNTHMNGLVEGLGDDEEIPWWLAPYVRDFATLAKSTALIDAQKNTTTELALASLTHRLAQTAAVARVAAHVKGNEGLATGVSAALAAEIDEFCGTPPHPPLVNQAGLVLALIASSLGANDPAKSVLVAQAERLQKLRGQLATAA